jgi:integrase/recombinase XerC
MHCEECSGSGGELSIRGAVEGCLIQETSRGLQPRSLKELGRYLGELASHCEVLGLVSTEQVTATVLRECVLERCRGGGAPLVKAVVWSLRSFGGYLALRGLVGSDPAAALRHLRISPRAILPRYLAARHVRLLLETAAGRRPGRDLTSLALLVTTGLRPHEAVSLRREEIMLGQCRLRVRVKGGWFKHTPLSESMAAVLGDYLEGRQDDCPAAFVGASGRPVSLSWLQRMVAQAGHEAGLPLRLTPRLLRHTFATHAADRHGRPITTALLGHRHGTTTDVYTHLSPRRFRALMQRHPYQATIPRGSR